MIASKHNSWWFESARKFIEIFPLECEVGQVPLYSGVWCPCPIYEWNHSQFYWFTMESTSKVLNELK